MHPTRVRPLSLLVFTLCLPLCSLCLCGKSFAYLDPETHKRYQLHVVLSVAKHRLLTPTFQDRLERELRDSLQVAFGNLARVTVARDHPLLKAVEEQGLQKALEQWTEVSPAKTHFVLVDFRDGRYEIQARQHDGMTSLPSPIVQRDATPDPEFVARKAALLIGKDFGVVGTITEQKDEVVKLTLKASGLGTPPDGWVKKGDIFAIVQISQLGDEDRASPVPWAILRVEEEPKEGVCTCRLFQRRTKSLSEGRGTLGFRCLKLNTQQVPLHLRLVQQSAPGQAAGRDVIPVDAGTRVHLQRRGFDSEQNAVQGVTDPEGYFHSSGLTDEMFEGIAFVRVIGSNNQDVAHIPIAMVDDRTVVCPVDVRQDPRAQLLIRRELWLLNVYDSLRAQNQLYRQLHELVGKPGAPLEAFEAAIQKAKSGTVEVQNDIENLNQTRRTLMEDSKGQLDLKEGDQRLAELAAARKELDDFVGRLQAGIENVKRNAQKGEQIRKAQEAFVEERQWNYDKALKLYKEAIAGGLDDEALKKKAEWLEKTWTIKSEAHRTAREFVYKTWPKFDLRDMKAHTEQARDAFEECRKVGDFLTVNKLLEVAVAHTGELKKQSNALRPDEIPDDRRTLERIKDATELLAKLMPEVSKYLEEQQKTAP